MQPVKGPVGIALVWVAAMMMVPSLAQVASGAAKKKKKKKRKKKNTRRKLNNTDFLQDQKQMTKTPNPDSQNQ